MGTILDQVTGTSPAASVRCPICAQYNSDAGHCRHVRWTFEQGDPVAFARFAIAESPYTRRRGHQPQDITDDWWAENAGWVVDHVMLRFEADGGFVFGELADMDILARDIWNVVDPEPERPAIVRQ
jgi:hypothetical protein